MHSPIDRSLATLRPSAFWILIMNLSETAFAYPLPSGEDADWALRWFTPTIEVDLCGHATLATAHALHADHRMARTVAIQDPKRRPAAMQGNGAITLDGLAAALGNNSECHL
jgi:hypothetical protein